MVNEMLDFDKLIKEHYLMADGKRCGTEHSIGGGYKIVLYDHDAVHFDSPAKARLELNGELIYSVTARELEDLDFRLLEKRYSEKNSG